MEAFDAALIKWKKNVILVTLEQACKDVSKQNHAANKLIPFTEENLFTVFNVISALGCQVISLVCQLEYLVVEI